MNTQTNFFVCAGLFVAALCSGCNKEPLPADLPKLHSTVITVVQDGKPFEGALVTMHNADTLSKWACAAKTNASGKATMMTGGKYPGAPEGTYKVTVVKQEVEKPDPYADAPDPNVDYGKYQEWLMKNEAKVAAAERQQPVVLDLVDPQFGTVAKTTLEVTVTAGKNEQTLDVGKAVRSVNKEESVR
jgi:hypothetical protein